MFLWAEAVATACYTQNRSLIHTRHDKTPYELVRNKKPGLTFFWVFGALYYPTNDSEDLGKLQPMADIGIFRLDFIDSLAGKGTGPALTFLMPGHTSLGLVPNPLQHLMYPQQQLVNSAGIPSSTTIDQDAHSLSHSSSSSALQSPISHQGVAAGSTIIAYNPFAPVDNNPFINVFALEPSSKASSSGDVSSADLTHVSQPHHHLEK
ncbi:retrovirus-related pol polyprotein from transposon TNT 1-94 [Tanacetum coccineum]